MKKILLSAAFLALAMTGAQAQVAINATNFPDDNFRAQVKEYFDNIDEDDIISAEEMEANGGHLTFDRVSNLKGIELLTSITELYLVNYPDEPSLKTFDYALPNLSTLDIQDQVGELTTVDASKCTNLETFLAGGNPANLSTLKLPSGIKSIALNNAPLIKTFDPKLFSSLRSVAFTGTTGITDLDFSDHKSIQDIGVDGIHDYYQLNSLIMANCPMLTNIGIKSSTIKSLTFKSLPEVLSILVDDSDITNMLVDDLVQLGSIEALDNVLGTLTLNNLPTIYGLDCHNNKLQTLIIDKCPNMNGIWAEHNRLMWLDLQDVKKNETDENSLKIDDQRPSMDAYKLSPTEVGLKVHERFEVERVLKLVANNKNVTPAWAEYDGVKYFVFSNEGANADALKGEKTSYQYETRWPYAWMDGNSEDNNLPVSLTVNNVLKLDSWIDFPDGFQWKKEAEVNGTLNVPQKDVIMRSDGYDGKLTFTSSDENVVKVNAETGAVTIVGPGKATITISGAATDYRNAPATISYQVEITAPNKSGDINGDGKVNGTDIQKLINFIVDEEEYDPMYDINGDGKVNGTDIQEIINIIVEED